ncbi:snRNA-activating protein complex subunit 1b [Clinocottus analis]|uniref:snRNA-activating protein complex subunit 1b n=1 Tax=Clinocottus analis TaxID=304258 RepID=UPI0035BEC1B5
MDFCQAQVKADCVELLSRFQLTNSVRFQTFSTIWKEMQFSQIYYGTVNHREKRAFSRLILDTAYVFFLPPYSFQIRVGGLYLLHSLYRCQITSPPEQIRLALKDWDDVKKLEKDAVNAQHHDAVYILRKLTSDKAFCFTAMPTTLVFKKKRKVERAALCEEFLERPSRPQELINVELLDELSKVDELYKMLKTSVSSESTRADSSIDLVRKDLVPQLRSTVMDFYDWQHRKDGADEGEDSGEGTSSQQECSRRAQLIASIKSKAYGEAAEASKSRRHRQVEVDFSSNVAGPQHASGYIRTTKPSLKARTYQSIRISGDLWNEAATSSRIKCLTELDFGPEGKKKKNNKFKW